MRHLWDILYLFRLLFTSHLQHLSQLKCNGILRWLILTYI